MEGVTLKENPTTPSPLPALRHSVAATAGSASAWEAPEQEQEAIAEEPGPLDAMKHPPLPPFDPPLVKFEHPHRNDYDALVEDWRADFIKARQAMRRRLQEQLWRRTQVCD